MGSSARNGHTSMLAELLHKLSAPLFISVCANKINLPWQESYNARQV
jgi:hypothetical protein